MSHGTPRSWPDVPGYEIVRVIGRGGFGTVYEARQLSVDRTIALKVLSAESVDAAAERRFPAESRAIGALSWHHHVVSLYDAGVTPGGEPFLVMELVPGGSLGEHLRAGESLDATRVLAVASQVSDALAAAHAAGVLHRDVKPDNVLVDRRGNHLLGDFGIATLTDGTRSTTGTFTGTYAYTAPEILRGERATAQSDLFSLGATLYALASGRPPFSVDTDASPAAQLVRILQDDPPPLPPSVPLGLADLILTLLAKDPRERPTSAAEVHALVEAIRSGPGQQAQSAAGAPTAARPTVAAALPEQDDRETVAVGAAPPSPPTASADTTGFGDRGGDPTASGPPHPPADVGPLPTAPSGGRRWAWIAAVLVVVALVAGLAIVFAGHRDGGDSVGSAGSTDVTVDLELRPVLEVAACGSSGGDGSGETGQGSAGMSSGEGAMTDQFAPTSTTIAVPGDTSTTSPTTTTTAPTTTAPLGTSTVPPTAPDPDLQGTAFQSEDGAVCYTLGPAGATGADLEDAHAALSGSMTWGVEVSARPSSAAAMNDLFNACYAADPSCPAMGTDGTGTGRGQLAIVVDGEVVSAPAVNGPDLADDTFTISGSFTEAEAKALADGLS